MSVMKLTVDMTLALTWTLLAIIGLLKGVL